MPPVSVDPRNFAPELELDRQWRAAGRWYDIRDYGAVGDGVTDDTAAWLAACAAAEVTGGLVWIPPGRYVITQGYTFTAGLNGTNRAVWVQGGGHHNTCMLFRPSNLASNCIKFGNGTDYYFGGGVQDLCIWNDVGTCTGAGVNIHVTIHTEIRDVYSRGFAGVNGAGLRVRSNGSANVQHLYLSNVYCQQNYWGVDAETGASCVAVNLKINQNTFQGLKLVKGDLLWLGGLLQGGGAQPAAVIGDMSAPGTTGAITLQNVYVEYLTASVIFDLYAVNFVQFKNCPWAVAGTPQTFVRCASSAGIAIEDINLPGGGGHKFLDSTSSSGRVRAGAPTDYAIDGASTWDFVGANGQGPTAIRATAAPASGATALALGGPLKLPSYTTAQRDALGTPQVGWLIWNSTTGTVQAGNGSTWASL